MALKLPPLYPIVNVAGDRANAVESALALAIELAAAEAGILQLRAKHLAAGAFARLAERLVRALEGSATLLVINDRADVASAVGADGVHVGDDDLSVSAVRRVVGRSSVVGYSTHSAAEAASASSLAADYLGFGPVFESPTKAGVREARGVEQLAEACRVSSLPIVAIGGITLATAADCWRAGAASVAVIREIENAEDRRALVAAYREAARAAA